MSRAVFTIKGDRSVRSSRSSRLSVASRRALRRGRRTSVTLDGVEPFDPAVPGDVSSERRELSGLVEEGKLKQPQIRTFPLEEAGKALAEIEGGHVRGKLAILPS